MKWLRTMIMVLAALTVVPPASAQRTDAGVELKTLFQAGIDAVEQGRYKEAIRQGEAFNATVAKLMGPGTPNEAYGYLLIAMGHSYQNQSAQAVEFGSRAYRAFGGALGPADLNTLAAGTLLAGDLAKSGAVVAARALMDSLAKQGIERTPAAADYYLSRSVVERFAKDYPASERAARESLKLTVEKSGLESDAAASRLFVLAQVLALQPAKAQEAQRTLAQARDIAARTYGPHHPRTAEMLAYRPNMPNAANQK